MAVIDNIGFSYKNDPGICPRVSVGVFAVGKDLDCSGGGCQGLAALHSFRTTGHTTEKGQCSFLLLLWCCYVYNKVFIWPMTETEWKWLLFERTWLQMWLSCCRFGGKRVISLTWHMAHDSTALSPAVIGNEMDLSRMAPAPQSPPYARVWGERGAGKTLALSSKKVCACVCVWTVTWRLACCLYRKYHSPHLFYHYALSHSCRCTKKCENI